MTFDLKINLGHSDRYFTVQWFLFFALKNILVLLAKRDSGELRWQLWFSPAMSDMV